MNRHAVWRKGMDCVGSRQVNEAGERWRILATGVLTYNTNTDKA